MPAPDDYLRDRLKAFLVFLRPKLLVESIDGDRLNQLRRMSDVRIRQNSVGKPRVTGLELCALLSDPRTGRLDDHLDATGLLRKGHLAVPVPALSDSQNVLVEACLLLQTLGQDRTIGYAKAYVAQAGVAPEAPGAPAKVVEAPLPGPVAKLLGGVKDLWSMPAQTLRILELLGTDAPTDQVSAEIEKDPALAAQCLRVVNSSTYGLGTRVASIKRAVVTLGYQLTRRIVSISSLTSRLGKPHAEVDFDLRAFWVRTLHIAHGAGLIAKAVKIGSPDEHFSAGLLHAIGKLVEYQHLRPHLKQILFRVEKGATWSEAELSLYGTTYAEIGACLCERWRFPSLIVESARRHLATAEELEELQIPREAVVVAALHHVVGAQEYDLRAWSGFLRLAPEQVPPLLQQAGQMAREGVDEIFST